MKKNKRKGWGLLILIGFLMFVCTACGKKSVDVDQSPELVNASVTSWNQGSEDSQFIKICLKFNKKISVIEEERDSLRITIAGERIKEEEYQLELGEDEFTAVLIISVDAITTGVLKVGISENADTITGILDADGKYAVKEFELEGLIPSGVSLSTVRLEDGLVVKQVDSYWNIRSIAWVGLVENGNLVPVSETRALEMLDGRAAVHGHEFLMEDESDIAESIVEVLESNYGEEYLFSRNHNQITAQKVNSDAVLDIEIYQYLRINGEEITVEQSEDESVDNETNADDSEHEAGLKIRVTDMNREVSEEEQELLQQLRISRLSDEGISDGTELYQTVTITGEAMPEEQVYSVCDLEELIRISYGNEQMYALKLPVVYDNYIGLDFITFLELCGAAFDQQNLTLLCTGKDGAEKSFSLEQLEENNAVVLLALDQLKENTEDTEDQDLGPVRLMIFQGEEMECVNSLSQVIVGTGSTPSDPEYGFHNREPHTESLPLTFTVEVYQNGAEYLGAMSTFVFTTEDMEQLMREHPEAVVGNYYGTIGNRDIYQYMGAGGWLDYFEGIDLRWLLKEQIGLKSLSGHAELIGRDGEVYGSVEDLAYIEDSQQKEEYYTMTLTGTQIFGTIPMISCVKNGAPILQEHDHESSGYIAYNHLNQRLEQEGIDTEVGVVKNHNGPFVACFGNRDGYYGGNQVETGGDCVLIRLYLDEI